MIATTLHIENVYRDVYWCFPNPSLIPIGMADYVHAARESIRIGNTAILVGNSSTLQGHRALVPVGHLLDIQCTVQGDRVTGVYLVADLPCPLEPVVSAGSRLTLNAMFDYLTLVNWYLNTTRRPTCALQRGRGP